MKQLNKAVQAVLSAAPRAAVEAERDYHQIWADWLTMIAGLAADQPPEERIKTVRSQLNRAPVMRLAANLDLGIVARFSEIKERDGGISIGGSVGAVTGSGSFGFMRQEANESTLQVRGNVVLANDAEVTLADYLKQHSIELNSVDDLDNAIARLSYAPE